MKNKKLYRIGTQEWVEIRASSKDKAIEQFLDEINEMTVSSGDFTATEIDPKKSYSKREDVE